MSRAKRKKVAIKQKLNAVKGLKQGNLGNKYIAQHLQNPDTYMLIGCDMHISTTLLQALNYRSLISDLESYSHFRLSGSVFRHISPVKPRFTEDIVKLQVLNLAVKLYLTNPSQTRLLCQYVFSLARYDQNYDIRDRSRFLRQFVLSENPLAKHAHRIFLANKPAPQLISKFKGKVPFRDF